MWLLKRLSQFILNLTKPQQNREKNSRPKKMLPFALALFAGVSWLDVIQKGLHKLTKTEVVELRRPQKQEQELNRDFDVLSVPAMDFTDKARRSWGFVATVKLDAEFEDDGKISNVKPATIFDPQFASGFSMIKGLEYPELIHFNHHPVKSLPFNLLETAVEAAKAIEFKPQIKTACRFQPKQGLYSTLCYRVIRNSDSSIKTSINESWHNEQYVRNTYQQFSDVVKNEQYANIIREAQRCTRSNDMPKMVGKKSNG